MRRLVATVGLGAALAWLSAGVAAAAPVAWTLEITPNTVTTGATTTFSLTATNELLGQIRCLWVDVPATFAVHGAAVVGSSEGGAWTSSMAGSRVRVWTTSGGQELRPGAWVRFTIRATATAAGQAAWNANAYPDQECSSGSTALSGTAPVVVVTDPPPTATPAPTVAPTVVPSAPATAPTPTPKSTPTPRAHPSPAPATPRVGTPTPSAAAASSTAAPAGDSPEPAASGQARIEGGGAAGPPDVPLSGGTPQDDEGAAEVGVTSDRWLRIQLAEGDSGGVSLALGTGVGDATIWLVPAAAIAGPGILLLVMVGLQAAGAAAWIPAVRQLRGERRESPPDIAP